MEIEEDKLIQNRAVEREKNTGKILKGGYRVIGKRNEILKKIRIVKNKNNIHTIVNLILSVFYIEYLEEKVKNLFLSNMRHPDYNKAVSSIGQRLTRFEENGSV